MISHAPTTAATAQLLLALAATADAWSTYGINEALSSIVVVEGNILVHGPGTAAAAVDTAAQLQQLLDRSPNTAVYLRRSRFEVVPDGNRTGIAIHSNQSLVLDEESVIWCNSTLPPPL